MVDIPTRDDLYRMVDERWRAEYPNGPERLSANRPDEEEMRNRWIAIRNDFLEKEANRVYWANHPDAPRKIDPNDPTHDAYQRAWIEIRDEIMANAPHLPDSPDDAVSSLTIDDSWLQASINEKLVDFLRQAQPDLHDDINAYAAQFLADVRKAVQDGTFPTDPNGDSFHPPDVTLTSSVDSEHKVQLWGSAWRNGNKIEGFLGFHAEKPLFVTF